jgi:cytochrome c553
MKTFVLLVAGLAFTASAAATAAPLPYKPPPETAELDPGPNVEFAQGFCSVCHSLDYITTQPRQLPDPAAFWTAEVSKMQKAYGARLSDDNKQKIIEYLARAYK